MSTDRDRRLAELLHEAAESHHTVYRISDGDDPDWPRGMPPGSSSFSELPDVLGRRPTEVTSCMRSSSSTATTPPRSRRTGGKTGTPTA
jgi:hypothetical protein